MELFLLILAVVFVLLAAVGRVADTRDYADWRPTRDGFRDPP
jgi:hypothetical protein